jgi:polar amino acid transport system substrate-binding protein
MNGAQPATDPQIAELVQAGRVRVALYIPQYTKDPITGALAGWTVDLVAALGARLGVEGVPVEHPTPAHAMASLKAGVCDAAILGIEPSRAVDVDYTPAVVQADYTLLVPAGSSIGSVAAADHPLIRVAAVRDHASTMTLARILKQATLVYADMPDLAFELLRTEKANAFASLREILLRYSTQLPCSRVLDERYGFNALGIAVPKGHAGRLAYLSEFVEEAKASGLVQRALDHAGWRGVRVAPLELTTGGRQRC